MANDIHKVKGAAYWARVLGAPAPAYNPQEREWSIDVTLDAYAQAALQGLGLGKGVRTKGDSRGIFYTFKRREFKKKDGKPNQPIAVKDGGGKPWDQTMLLGNGSIVEVTYKVFPVPAFGKNPAHNRDAILEIRVLEHVPYEKKEAVAAQASTDSWKGDVV